MPDSGRRRRRDVEGPIQRSIISYLRQVIPGAPVVHHSPAEMRRAGRAGDVNRAMNAANGVLPGFPDILVLLPDGATALFEVKAPGGSASRAQIAMHADLARLGHRCAVVRSIDETRAALQAWGVQTREAA